MTCLAVAAVCTVAFIAAPAVATVTGATAVAVSTGAVIVGATATAIGVTASTIGLCRKVAEEISRIDRQHEGNYTVYALRDKSGRVQYVGRTKNLDQRLAQHKKAEKTKELVLDHAISGLTWCQARGLEELGMLSYHTLNALSGSVGKNSIHGVSIKNPNRKVYLKAAWNYMYNKTTDTWYNLMEQ